MQIERIVNYYNSQNCYLVFDDDKNGIIIDPGSESEEIEQVINDIGVTVSHIFLTHCHYDHIGGLSELRKNLNAKVYASFECNQNIQNPNVNMSVLQHKILKEEPCDEILNDGTLIKVGNLEIKTITIPDSVTKIDENAFLNVEKQITVITTKRSAAARLAEKKDIKLQIVDSL